MKLIKAIVGSESVVEAGMVEAYLRQHPAFFEEHLDLLESLAIPHPSGEAVSLVARQLDLLRQRNGKLQKQLSEILQIARDNDGLARRLHQLTLAMLDATCVDDALAGLRWSLHEGFEADFVCVRLLEPRVETPIGDLYAADDGAAAALADFIAAAGPQCGQPTAEQAARLFGSDADRVASYAAIPLSHAGLSGILAIGSCDPHRFDAGMGHHFLSQMGEIVAARLVNLLTVGN